MNGHIDKDTFDRCQLQIKAGSASSKCKFSERAKCEIEVKKPNELGVDWLYSVPCGQKHKKDGPCPCWIFWKVPEGITYDTHKTKEWVTEYLEKRKWGLICNNKNKRFICPQCVKGYA